MNLEENIKKLVVDSGHSFSPEINDAIQHLEELISAENKSGIEDVLVWLKARQAACSVSVNEIGLSDLEGWSIDPENKKITHSSGKFFSIIGVKISKAGEREVSSWSQPMLKQEECGISGVLRKRFRGVMHYLFYAKFEPGNINLVQLSPSLQATESNLTRAHLGAKPRLAEYFEGSGKGKLIKSVVGVEDGGRFYRKTNKSMLVEVDESEEIEITDDYIWLTLPQIKKLLLVDNAMNSLARNVCAIL